MHVINMPEGRASSLPVDVRRYPDALVLVQALDQHSTFDIMQWWTAFDARCSLQCEQLRTALRGNQHKSTSNASEGSWLKGLFQGKPQQGRTEVSSQVLLSDADIGRAQLQLQSLTRTKTELNLIQRTVKAALCIWAQPKGKMS